VEAAKTQSKLTSFLPLVSKLPSAEKEKPQKSQDSLLKKRPVVSSSEESLKPQRRKRILDDDDDSDY